MSRIDAALRRARALRPTTDAGADWQDLTPAVHASPWELEQLPSENGAPAARRPSALELVEPGGADAPTVFVSIPVPLPPIAVAPHRPGTDEPAIGPSTDPAVPIIEVLDPPPAADPVVSRNNDSRMFEALDRVLAESPLAGSRRAGHGRSDPAREAHRGEPGPRPESHGIEQASAPAIDEPPPQARSAFPDFGIFDRLGDQRATMPFGAGAMPIDDDPRALEGPAPDSVLPRPPGRRKTTRSFFR